MRSRRSSKRRGKDRLSEVERITAHVELSLTELLQRADEEIGRAAAEVDQKIAGAEGRLAQAEDAARRVDWPGASGAERNSSASAR